MPDTLTSQQTCREKTARGNRFNLKGSAKRAASAATRRNGSPITWFRCRVCAGCHLGGVRDYGERVARRVTRKEAG